ncbi:MAG: GNAT family N-acetyltransferase [Anaerolineae bacterium]
MKSVAELPVRLETERLYLRPYRTGDGSMYLSVGLRNRAHLARYEAENPLVTITDEVEAENCIQGLMFEWEKGSAFFWGAFDRQTDAFVVQIYVGVSDRDLPACELGYIVDCDHEGQGYVTEAAKAALAFVFDHLGAHRVSLHCDETNVRSARVAERCGFTLEGRIREDKRDPDGGFTDTLCYGLLRREYVRARAPLTSASSRNSPPPAP